MNTFDANKDDPNQVSALTADFKVIKKRKFQVHVIPSERTGNYYGTIVIAYLPDDAAESYCKYWGFGVGEIIVVDDKYKYLVVLEKDAVALLKM